jgi:hypothetical protein
MGKIKITEEQAKMLKEMGKTKLLKVTQEQYNKILEMEKSISEKNLSPMGKSMVKQANPIDRPQMSRDLKNNLPEMYEKFINELYSVSESTERVYEKLHKLMEGAGLINNGKLVKEKFDGDKERVKQVISAGLYEMSCGGTEYKAMEAIEEALELKDITADYFRKQIGEPKKSGKSREELIAAIKRKREESKAIEAQKEEEREEALRALANRENEDRIEEDGDYPTGAEYDLSAPWNQKDPDYREGEKIEGDYETVSHNGEVAILKDKKGNLFAFHYYGMDNSEFEPYADIEREYVGKDEDGMPDYDYADEFDIDGDVITSYVNDNIDSMSVGQGLGDFESGVDLALIDSELKNDLLSVYSNLEGILNNTNETTTAGSAGAFVGAPALGGETKYKPEVKIVPEEEIEEATTMGGGAVPTFDIPMGRGDKDKSFWHPKGSKGPKMKGKKVNEDSQTETQWKGGSFVKVKDECNKFPYCDQGAGAIELKKTKRAVISNDHIIQEVAKKTNRSVEEVKKIINNKNI